MNRCQKGVRLVFGMPCIGFLDHPLLILTMIMKGRVLEERSAATLDI